MLGVRGRFADLRFGGGFRCGMGFIVGWLCWRWLWLRELVIGIDGGRPHGAGVSVNQNLYRSAGVSRVVELLSCSKWGWHVWKGGRGYMFGW